MVKFAIDILRRSKWSPQLSDKDSGFVLVQREELHGLLLRHLPSSHYEYALEDSIGNSAFKFGYKKLVKRIWNVEKSKMLNFALQDSSSRFLIAKVTCTIKSHKPDGLVVPRILHACVNSRLRA
eukprot:8820187-Karenia_brevis.AAC.1